MNSPLRSAANTLSIAAVERDTGLSKDTLRVWERRYGFPLPARDGVGERAYPLQQVQRLRIIKRLLDAGHRPGRVVMLPLPDLQQMAESSVDPPQRKRQSAPDATDLILLLDLIRGHDVVALRYELACLLARSGLGGFVVDVLTPLGLAVGDACMRGQLQVFEEHLYSEVVQSGLIQALAAIAAPTGDKGVRVLLTTLPGEPQGLGLLMAQAMLALEGCACVSLGVQTPVLEIARAATALRSQVVVLGFNGGLSARQMQDSLAELRAELPAEVALWTRSSAPGLQRRAVAGVQMLDSLAQIQPALRQRQSSIGA